MILERLRSGPATVSQVAEAFGVHPANLTRHFRLLLGAGLIILQETRDTGRNLEKYYAATAESFVVTADAAALANPRASALKYALSDLAAAIPALKAEDDDSVCVLVHQARVPRPMLPQLRAAIEALVASFGEVDAEDGVPYHLNVALYPLPVAEGGAAIRLEDKGRRR